jgi:hypothetical protein
VDELGIAAFDDRLNAIDEFQHVSSNADNKLGNLVKPREWFLVPLQVIDKAVERIPDGSVTDLTGQAGTLFA